MYYFLIFLNIVLFVSVLRLAQRIDSLERACTKAVGELEQKNSLAELEKKESELSELNKKWILQQDELCDAVDAEDETKIERLEGDIEALDKEIETLEKEIKHLRWAKCY